MRASERKRVKIMLTRAQATTLRILLETQLMVSDDHHDLMRYRAIKRACDKALDWQFAGRSALRVSSTSDA